MRSTMTRALLVAILVALAAPACKKGKDTETPLDAKPSRPLTPSGTMSLRGEYTQAGELGTFRDCTTGQQWPVSNEGDNEALQEAYLASGAQPGPLLVTVEGGIDYRSPPDRKGKEMMLIVARFVQADPSKTCGDMIPPRE